MIKNNFETNPKTLDLFPIGDTRDSRYIDYSIRELITRRVFQIAAGYEDCNDCNDLRGDMVFKTWPQEQTEQRGITAQKNSPSPA